MHGCEKMYGFSVIPCALFVAGVTLLLFHAVVHWIIINFALIGWYRLAVIAVITVLTTLDPSASLTTITTTTY